MIKTIEQLNREFLGEYRPNDSQATPAGVTAQSAAVQDYSSAVKDEEKMQFEYQPKTDKDRGRRQSVSGSTEQPRGRGQAVWKDLLFLVLKIVMIASVFILLFTFLFGFVRYGEPSMTPAIRDGDLVIFYRYIKVGYLPQDAIVLERDGQKQVRRVVATAGDVVDITEDGLVINGALQQEMGVYHNTERYIEGVSLPLTVPEGHVFILGDSRTGATDSRIYGPVMIEDTLGKVMAVIRFRSI